MLCKAYVTYVKNLLHRKGGIMELKDKVEGIIDKELRGTHGDTLHCVRLNFDRDLTKELLSLINQEVLKGRIDEAREFRLPSEFSRDMPYLYRIERIKQLQSELKSVSE